MLFQNILFKKKNFLRAMAILGYLSQLQKGMGLAFGSDPLLSYYLDN